MKALTGMLAGLLFGPGLRLAGMTHSTVALGFQVVVGDWDPRLMFVQLAAALTTAAGDRWVLRPGVRSWRSVSACRWRASWMRG